MDPQAQRAIAQKGGAPRTRKEQHTNSRAKKRESPDAKVVKRRAVVKIDAWSRNDEARIAPCLRSLPSRAWSVYPGMPRRLLTTARRFTTFASGDSRFFARDSCAVPFWCAARPPFAAIARCA